MTVLTLVAIPIFALAAGWSRGGHLPDPIPLRGRAYYGGSLQ